MRRGGEKPTVKLVGSMGWNTAWAIRMGLSRTSLTGKEIVRLLKVQTGELYGSNRSHLGAGLKIIESTTGQVESILQEWTGSRFDLSGGKEVEVRTMSLVFFGTEGWALQCRFSAYPAER